MLSMRSDPAQPGPNPTWTERPLQIKDWFARLADTSIKGLDITVNTSKCAGQLSDIVNNQGCN